MNSIKLTEKTNDFTVTETGEAFISQRKAAELLGVNSNTLMSYITRTHSKTNTSKGLNAFTLQTASTYFAYESKTSTGKAKEFLKVLLEVGAKAYIYHEAGYEIKATPKSTIVATTPEELMLEYMSEGLKDLALQRLEMEASRLKSDKELEERKKKAIEYLEGRKIKGSEELYDIKLAQDKKALANREFTLVDGVKVAFDIKASTVLMPHETATYNLKKHKSNLRADQFNRLAYSIGLMEDNTHKGDPKVLADRGLKYGINQRTGDTLQPRWFIHSFEDVLNII